MLVTTRLWWRTRCGCDFELYRKMNGMPKQQRDNLSSLLRQRETPFHHAARKEERLVHNVNQRLEEVNDVIDAAIEYADTCSFFLEDKLESRDFSDPLSDLNKLVAKIEKWVAIVNKMTIFSADSDFILDTIEDRVSLYRRNKFFRTNGFFKYVGAQLLRWVASVDPAKGALLGEVNDIGGTGNPYCVHI